MGEGTVRESRVSVDPGKVGGPHAPAGTTVVSVGPGIFKDEARHLQANGGYSLSTCETLIDKEASHMAAQM